ncbi:hypothetical protein [Roseateles sp. P5_D6]
MPSFDGRRRELRAALATLQSTLDITESTRIAGVIEDYLNARDAVLTMVLVFLEDDSAEPLAPEYASKFRDTTRAAQDKLDNMLSGVSTPSEAAVRFREQVEFEEMAFWGLIGKLKLAESRDALVDNGSKVWGLISSLDKKWQNLCEEDLRVEEAEQKAAQDLKDLLERALATAMPAYVQMGTAVLALKDAWKAFGKTITDHVTETLINAGAPRKVVEALMKVASWANDMATFAEIGQMCGIATEAVLDVLNKLRSMNVGGLVQYRLGLAVDSGLKNVLSAIDLFRDPIRNLVEVGYYSRLAVWKAALDNEGVIIVAYGGIRQQVDEFLKACNLDGTRATHAAVVADMDRVASGLRTDGQKSDWSEVQRGLKDIFDRKRAGTEKAFEDFFRANDGRFMGGLSTDTERALLEPDKWLVTTNGVIAVGLDTKLREWRQNVTVLQGGPREAFDSIQDAFLGLPLDVRDKVKGSVNDYVTKQMNTLNTEAEKTLALLDKCELMVNARKISDDLDRARLSQALRATIR